MQINFYFLSSSKFIFIISIIMDGMVDWWTAEVHLKRFRFEN